MIRRYLTLAVALLMALTGTASASRAITAAPVTSVPDAVDCGGKGFTKLFLTTGKAGCVHTKGDAFDSRAAARGTALGIKPAVAKVPCYGDGTTGPRIQMIYGYHQGLPNRGAAVTAQFRSQMAPRMQAVINNQSDGRNLGLRFAMTKGCGAIDVKVIQFPRDVQYGTDNPGNPAAQLVAASNYLDKLGYNRDDRKYQILWDGWNVGACGIGFLEAELPGASLPGNPFSDGLPTLGGHTAPSAEPVPHFTTKYSMIFNHAGGPHGGTCFNTQGMSTVLPQIHELFHTLGAVQLDAPHANTGHCDDAPSIMCPGGGVGYGLGINNPSCAKVLIETLDCGEDDYWNPNPRAGSYLSTHLNVARSQFFGPQLQDNLASSSI